MESNCNKGFNRGMFLILVSILVVIGLVIGATSYNRIVQLDHGSSYIIAERPIDSFSVSVNNNSYLRFDGVNDYIELDPILSNPEQFTLSGWIYIFNDTIGHDIFYQVAGTNLYPRLMISTGGTIYCQARNSTSNTHTASVANYFDNRINEWIHVACTFNTTNSYIYANNIAEDINSHSTFDYALSGANTMTIGRDANSGYYTYGFMDELRVYNRSLVRSEIAELYNSGRHPNSSLPSDDLVLWYTFNEGSGSIVNDYSGEGNYGI